MPIAFYDDFHSQNLGNDEGSSPGRVAGREARGVYSESSVAVDAKKASGRAMAGTSRLKSSRSNGVAESWASSVMMAASAILGVGCAAPGATPGCTPGAVCGNDCTPRDAPCWTCGALRYNGACQCVADPSNCAPATGCDRPGPASEGEFCGSFAWCNRPCAAGLTCTGLPPGPENPRDYRRLCARPVDGGALDGGSDAGDSAVIDAPDVTTVVDVPTRDATSDVLTDTPTDARTGSMSALSAIVSRTLFDELFLHRGTAPCRGAFYTYDAFIRAAEGWPTFASDGTDEVRRREVAAFLANIAHETTGGWDTAPGGRYAWGLCWIEEGGATPQTADYCAASAEFPCAPGQRYYGRGPMQLSWNYNYGQAGRALSLPLLSNPALVATDPVVAFRTALWFWMTPQSPKPSCHDVMVGRWTPSAADTAAGRLAGFGTTVNIINGGLECNRPTPPAVADRLGFYRRFTTVLRTTEGSNLDCATARPFG